MQVKITLGGLRRAMKSTCIAVKKFLFGDYFGPALSSTLVGVSLMLSLMLICIDTGKNQDRLFDFLAYMLPIIAGVVAGITALAKEEINVFYVLSCIVLVGGLFFYFVSKDLLLLGGTAAASVLVIWPASNTLADQLLERNKRPWTWFLVPGLYVLIALGVAVLLFWSTLKHYGAV